MITNVSWTDYLIATLLSLLIYYLFIGFRYYSSEFKSLAANRNQLLSTAFGNKFKNYEKTSVHPSNEPVGQNPGAVSFAGTTEDTAVEIEHLILKLKGIIENASLQNTGKKKLKENLGSILYEYPEIKNSPFQSAINELIVSECRRHGSIILSEDEVVMMWGKV